MNPAELPATISADDAFDSALAAVLADAEHRAGGIAADAEAIASAARLCCAALREGHVCALPPPELLPTLRRSALVEVVGSDRPVLAPGHASALVLDGPRLYLRRHWQLQQTVAKRLSALNSAAEPLSAEHAAAVLAPLFPADAEGAVNWQQLAVANALRRRLCILSGGPGTGKTTTVVRLLAALLSLQPELRVGLCAPTGKAAARMRESIAQQIDRLPIAPALRERLPRQTQTVHRLLGSLGNGEFRHHAAHPLALDLLIVDEASMLDLTLAARLLDALPAPARLILLGDKDQLASVEAGAVFAACSRYQGFDAATLDYLAASCGCNRAQLPAVDDRAHPLRNAVIWLRHSHRFAADSALGQLASAINDGDVDRACRLLQQGSSLQWQGQPANARALLPALQQRYAGYLQAVGSGAARQHCLDEFERYRLLCAHRSGSLGSEAVNAQLDHLLRRSLGAGGAEWYAGRPVIVRRNDYRLRLYNGDIGLCLPDARGELRVWFADRETSGGFHAHAPARLTAVDSAWALTVHQSQGSEFDRVDILLGDAGSPQLHRELLYTAVTRARHAVGLLASRDALTLAIGRRSERRAPLFDEAEPWLAPT